MTEEKLIGFIVIITGLFIFLSNTKWLLNDKRRQKALDRVFEQKKEMQR